MRETASVSPVWYLRSWLADRGVWSGAIIAALAAAYIEFGRRQAVAVPIPFLLLLGVVVLVASIGGKRAGIAGAAVVSLFIFYSMEVGFGPATLTGGMFQASLGSGLMLVVGFFLGRIRDQNRRLIGELEESHSQLEKRVEARTAELSRANEKLHQEYEDRLRTEAKLDSRDLYFQRLIENALDIVTVLNADGSIRYESPSVHRILGYEQEELIGKNALDYIHPDDLELARKEFSQALIRTNRSKTTEFRFRHKNGSWRLLEVIANNLFDDVYVSGLVINSRDITTRREIEKHAQRQSSLAMVGQLAAGIAHDFNNVMAVILLYAQLLERSPNLIAKEKKQLRTIIEEGMRAAGLTAQILDFGRQTVLDRKRVDLVPLLEEFVQLLELTLPASITIAMAHEKESYFVNADANRLQQALMNLALNSRDAMPDGGCIRLALTDIEPKPEEANLVGGPVSGGWVKLTVMDSGMGISNEGMKHLFEPFFTTKEQGKGTGLGLPQVYGIVKQHNGFIDVDTEVGRGTSFGIILPKDEGENAIEQVVSPDILITGNQEWLLIVEDNDATRIAMMVALESLNYKIISVRNGIEALTTLEQRPEVDLVISDVMMPDMGGAALVEAMAARGIETPLFLLTGDSSSEQAELIRVGGRVEVFLKPIRMETLSKIVARYLKG